MTINAPPNRSDVPLIHRVVEFYKTVYRAAAKIPKRDRYGIFLKIENVALETVALIIGAAFQQKHAKLVNLESARINTELLKRLIRVSQELGIVPEKWYLASESQLQEISKMLNGWIRYLQPKTLV